MDYKSLAEAGFLVDAKLVKKENIYSLESDGNEYSLNDILDHLVGKEIRLTVISRDVLLDMERAVVGHIEN